jgi:hypothetical protein
MSKLLDLVPKLCFYSDSQGTYQGNYQERVKKVTTMCLISVTECLDYFINFLGSQGVRGKDMSIFGN